MNLLDTSSLTRGAGRQTRASGLVYDETVVFGGKNVTVNLKHVQSGVYLVRLLDGNNATNFKITIE